MPTPPALLNLFGLLAAELKPFVETKGGLFSIANDPFHVTELLAEAPGRFRVILGWQSEQPQGDYRSGIVEESFRMVVSHQRGLPFLRGEGLVARPVSAPKSLKEQTAEVRDFIRGLYFDSESCSHIFAYGGTEPVRVDAEGKTYLLDAYEMTFRMLAGLPVITHA